MNGWIKLQRAIKEHWIWRDSVKLKWWIDILLSVNHSPTKVNIGNQLFECGRGQSIQSLSSWANQWGVSKDKARNFLVLLEKDGMISHESIGKSTRITVCNYDTYQCGLHDNQTITQQSNNGDATQNHPNNNDNKVKNENNDKKGCRDKTPRFIPPTLDDIKNYVAERGLSCDAEKFFDFYQSKGWMVGKNKMKDWRAAVRNWARTEKQDNKRDGIKFCNDEWK